MSSIAPSQGPQSGRPATRVLGGRYSLTNRIAVGGMGEVWAATDTVLGRQVAVKILRDDLVDSHVFLERFRAEARHTAALAHPGIASVFDYGEDRPDDRHVAYLVMELVPGAPLSKVLSERGALPVATSLSLLAQTADALHAAHLAGVVHRDVKPGNLLMLDNGTIKVTDFGIARAAGSAALTEVGQIIGTAMYISPEQAIGSEATPASDIYSLGVIGYEMLAGHPPFTAGNVGALAMAHAHQEPPQLPMAIPAEVRALIASALSKDPADRPRDAGAFAADLRRLQMATMPAPAGTAPAAAEAAETVLMPGGDDLHASTQMIGINDGSRTAIMPPGRIVSRAPELGLSQEAYASRRQRRRLGVAALIFLCLVGVVLVVGGGQGPLDDTIMPSTTVLPASVGVDPAALIGLPVVEASATLSTAGLLVATSAVDAVDVPAGVVTGVAPSGQVPFGATVTLEVSNGAVVTTDVETGNGRNNKPDKDDDD